MAGAGVVGSPSGASRPHPLGARARARARGGAVTAVRLRVPVACFRRSTPLPVTVLGCFVPTAQMWTMSWHEAAGGGGRRRLGGAQSDRPGARQCWRSGATANFGAAGTGPDARGGALDGDCGDGRGPLGCGVDPRGRAGRTQAAGPAGVPGAPRDAVGSSAPFKAGPFLSDPRPGRGVRDTGPQSGTGRDMDFVLRKPRPPGGSLSPRIARKIAMGAHEIGAGRPPGRSRPVFTLCLRPDAHAQWWIPPDPSRCRPVPEIEGSWESPSHQQTCPSR